MLSRRIIRVKVMQVLYANEIGKDISPVALESTLLRYIKSTGNLYYIYLMYLTEICNYALTHSTRLENKMIENEAFSTDLANNDVLKLITQSQGFKDYIGYNKLNSFIDKKLVKKLFLILITKERYQNYIANKARTHNDDIGILRYIIKKVMGPSQDLEDDIAENFVNIEDDSYYVLLSLQKKLKNFENNNETLFLHSLLLKEDNSELIDFAKKLLAVYIDNEEELISIIKPKIKNWDYDRIAKTDIVILKLAVSELKYFSNIPIKVTINEYIDLSKEYSTDKSKEFVNGILDKIMKELKDKGQIKKQGRGLIN